MSNVVKRYTYKVGNPNLVLGGQDIVNLNELQAPFQASILVDIVSNAARFSIEFTTDDVTGNNPAAFRWNPVTGVAPGQTSTLQYTLNYPVTAVRLNLASITGEVRLSVIQGLGLLR